MRNPHIKTWMWQRLWKVRGEPRVRVCLRAREDDSVFDTVLIVHVWLCPKPNLVLV